MIRRACGAPGLIALCCCACATTPSTSSSPEELPPGPVALRMRAVDGEALTLGGLRGRPVLVTVITTWAETALFEAPHLQALRGRYPRDRLEIICLVIDDLPGAAEVFVETFEPLYRVAVPEDLEGLVGERGPFGPIRVIPTSVLLDREGVIALRSDGVWPPGVIEAAIDQLLAADPGNR
ncbi:MAG: TlpA family protein disulfide reductase [Deltaproteobacteria bacterium]|nr:TlpA family protein disulfide reductase [Deltaproteobacteria bacterium]